MTTEILERTDSDTTVVPDLTTPEKCEHKIAPKVECDKAADWAVMTTCCGTVFLFCQEHFDELLESLNNFDKALCPRCKAIKAPPSTMILSADRVGK